jgi:RNA polymerase sigma factor (sigma-70 family)
VKSRPKHFERLLQFLRRRGRSHHDAEDIIQEAMLRLHVYGQAATVANEEAFLRHAVVNLSIDQHRRERPDLRRQVPVEHIDALLPLTSTPRNPEDTLDAQQRLQQIGRLLDASNRKTRQIYFAHRAGYSYEEISQHLGVSHMTIRRHISRALLLIMDASP